MADLARHIRIFNATPEDELVTKREKGIKAIETEFKKRDTVDKKFELVHSVAVFLNDIENPEPGIAGIVEAALRKQSASFVAEGSQLEIVTCALLALLQWVEASGNADILNHNDTLAISLWNSLSFQKPIDTLPKLEQLRSELIAQSQSRVHQTSLGSRKRKIINNVVKPPVPEDNTFTSFVETLDKGYSVALNNLRKNAVLDREEIDVLWWTLAGWGAIVEKSIVTLSPPQAAIVCGLDLAKILRRVPGQAHKNLIQRFIQEDLTLNADELLAALGDSSDAIKVHASGFAIVEKNPLAFPLLHILATGNTDINGADTKRTLSEWASRALLEGTMVNFGHILNDGI